MPGAFDAEELEYHEVETVLPPNVNRGVDTLAVDLDKVALDGGLDLSKHPAHELLNLPAHHSFSNITEFRRAVASTSDGAWILHSLAKMVEYDVSTNDKMSDQDAQWKHMVRAETKKTRVIQEELAQAIQELNRSQGEYSAMRNKRDELRKELESAQIQLTLERSKRGSKSEQHDLRNELREERSRQFQLLAELDETTKQNIDLQARLTEARKQPVAGGMPHVASVASFAMNYRPRGIGPKEQLTGTDPEAYAPWKWAVNDKLRVDAIMYPSEVDRINYAFNQLNQPIFQALFPWFQANSKNLAMGQIFIEIEHYMGIPMLASIAKRELNTVVMKGNETVTEYFHRLCKLWQQAGTPEDEKIDKFELTLKPSISSPLLALKHTNMRELLDAARSIENLGKESSRIFPRDSKTAVQKSSRTWVPGRISFPQASGGSTTGANTAAPAATGGSSTAPKDGRSADTNSFSVNARFMPTSTKPAGWVGTWYNPEQQSRKLQGVDKAMFLRQGRCWVCRGSGHRGSDACCPGHDSPRGCTLLQMAEESDSGAEKA